jgi:hypothetical protein
VSPSTDKVMGPPYHLRIPAARSAQKRRAPAGIVACALASLFMLSTGCGSTAGITSDGISRTERFAVPPVLMWSRNVERQTENRNFLGTFFRRSQDIVDGKRQKSLDVLWPLFSQRLESEPKGTGGQYYRRHTSLMLGLIFSSRSDNYGDGYLNVHFLWPLGQYFRGERKTRDDDRTVRSFRFLPLLQYERSWRAVSPARPNTLGLLDFEAPLSPKATLKIDERVHFRFLHIVYGMERGPTQRRQFLIGGAPKDEQGRKTTFGLWAHESGPSADYEHQLFWRALLLKRWGSDRITMPSALEREPSDFWRTFQWLWHGPPQTMVRLGPFMTFESDWESDSKRFSFLAGLFSVERQGPERRGKILWFIPWGRRRPGG